jgi:hypothetical protein
MVASSQRAFRDVGCSPTIPEVPLEIPTAGNYSGQRQGVLIVNRLVFFRRIARLDANHLKGVMKELRFDGAKAQEQISLA